MSDKPGAAPAENVTDEDSSRALWKPITVPDFLLQLTIVICLLYIVGPSRHGDLIADDILFVGQLDEAVAAIIAWQSAVALWRGKSRLFRKWIIPPDE